MFGESWHCVLYTFILDMADEKDLLLQLIQSRHEHDIKLAEQIGELKGMLKQTLDQQTTIIRTLEAHNTRIGNVEQKESGVSAKVAIIWAVVTAVVVSAIVSSISK